MSDVPIVVLDTNVLESAMRSRRGASFAVLALVGKGRFEIAVSVPLVLEYEEVLRRDAHRTASAIRDLLDYLCTVAKLQTIHFLWRPSLNDPRDEMVLELAIAAGCDAIVTHNRRDFEPAASFGVRILSPAEFLEEIGGV